MSMKTLLHVTFALAILNFPIFSNAQNAVGLLNINNVRASIYNNGGIINEGKFFVPNDSTNTKKSTIYSAGHWIGGLSGSQLYLAAETYRQTGFDYQPGPVLASYNASSKAYWNRVWKVSKADILQFRSNIENNLPVSQYTNILQWPAKGNITFGDSTKTYAPFVDVNGNGIYDPIAGDYPQIKGDLALYTIINDDLNHTESGGQKMQLEIHRMAYSFLTTNQPEVNNSIFVDTKVINQSNRNYDSVLFTSWVDFDLGDYADDFVGTDTARNMIYVYNGLALDAGPNGYGSTPPAQACVFMNHPLWSTMYYNNSTDAVSGNPTSPLHHFYYMNGLWKDGSAKVASGTGIGNTGTPTRFSFSGNPCANTGWWEGGESIIPGDRRILATAAPQTLGVGQELNYTLAYVYSRADTGNQFASVCALQTAVDSVTNWYQRQGFFYSSLVEKSAQEIPFNLYPNPSSGLVTIETKIAQTAMLTIYDVSGRVMIQQPLKGVTSLNIGEFAKGLYFVEVSHANGRSLRKLVVE